MRILLSLPSLCVGLLLAVTAMAQPSTLSAAAVPVAAASPAESSCVILLHGLARTSRSMSKLEEALAKKGYYVLNVDYDSREHEIAELAQQVIGAALPRCGERQVHFVGHSLGAILIRQYLSDQQISRLGHVVMLGPPNQGSEVVDRLRELPGFHLINGDAGDQLGTDALAVPGNLGPAEFDVGIIAGSRSINWILSTLIPGTDDGKVSIERTQLDGMNDHIVVPVSHPFLMRDAEAVAQVLHYLEHGRFDRQDI